MPRARKPELLGVVIAVLAEVKGEDKALLTSD
jgi:hypothetical protein